MTSPCARQHGTRVRVRLVRGDRLGEELGRAARAEEQARAALREAEESGQ